MCSIYYVAIQASIGQHGVCMHGYLQWSISKMYTRKGTRVWLARAECVPAVLRGVLGAAALPQWGIGVKPLVEGVRGEI
jgi:hypothetical protein